MTRIVVLTSFVLALGAVDARAQMTMGSFKGYLTVDTGAIRGGDVTDPRLTVGASVAVHEESAHTSGGRLRSSEWAMYLRADFLEDNVATLDRISNFARRWPQGNLWYLYGSFFMRWLAETRDTRSDVRGLLPEARSVVVLAMDYARPAPPDPGGLTGRVASYAWGRDYHALIGLRVRHLRRGLMAKFPGLQTWGGVDAAPSWERGWAEAAGLGFSGKNGMAIVPAEGSWFFLATILLSEELEPDLPLGDFCGRCRRCLDACPTGAIREPFVVDARLCIAYHTIENRDPELPAAITPALQGWVAGCDICQEVCPWNRPNLPVSSDADVQPRPWWLHLNGQEALAWSDEAWDERLRASALRRIQPWMWRRNIRAVLDGGGPTL